MKILIISEVGWFFLRQRHHEVALYFSGLGHDVVFAGPTLFRLPKLSRLFGKFKKIVHRSKTDGVWGSQKNHIELPTNLIVRVPLIIPNKVFVIWNRLWVRYFLNIEEYDLIYTFTPSIYFAVFYRTHWNKVVFDVVHNWWDIPNQPDNFMYRLANVLENSAGLVTDSDIVMAKLKLQFPQKPKLLMLPGVNIPDENYQTPPPHKTKYIRLLFFGNLRQNSDIEFFNKLAREENITVSIVGFIDPSIAGQLASKISYLGSVDQSEIFNLSKDFHGLILPYKNDAFSRTISPAKFFECLAMNRLIITRSNLSIFSSYEDRVLVLDEVTTSYYRLIRDALHAFNETTRGSSFETFNHSWGNRLSGLQLFLENEVEIGKLGSRS